MKNIKRLVLFLAFTVASNSFAGVKVIGNGGDANAMEFVNSGIRMFNFLKRHPASAEALGITPETFLSKIRRIRVESEDHLYLNGVEVDAINYPEDGLIKISNTRWVAISNLPDAIIQKQNLALHEYLWVLGFDDTNYRLSSTIIAEVRSEELILRPTPTSNTILGALCKAIVERDYVTARTLLQMRFDVNERCPYEVSARMTQHYPLPYLIAKAGSIGGTLKEDDLKLIESLLVAGANPNGYIDNTYWKTSLLSFSIRRSAYGGLEVAKLLVSYGADSNGQGLVNYDNRAGENKSALHEGISAPISDTFTTDFLNWIIEAGADMNRLVRANDGWIINGENTPACEILASSRDDLKKFLTKKVNVDSSLCKGHF